MECLCKRSLQGESGHFRMVSYLKKSLNKDTHILNSYTTDTQKYFNSFDQVKYS